MNSHPDSNNLKPLANQLLTLYFKDSPNVPVQVEGTAQELHQILDDLYGYESNKTMEELFKSPYVSGRMYRDFAGSQVHYLKNKFPLGDYKVTSVHHSSITTHKQVFEAKVSNPAASRTLHVPAAKPVRKIHKEVSILFRRNREHEQAHVILSDSTTVTCQETGISFKTELPAPLHLNLAYVHPLALVSNVEELVRQYSKKGIYLESQLSAQILAGMLITLLKHKKLLSSRDYPSANMCLQHVKTETLSFAVRFFSSARSVIGFPALHLIPEALYDFTHIPHGMTKQQAIADRVQVLIQNYLKICKGEDESLIRNVTPLSKAEKESGTVHIYGGNLSIESKQVDVREKLCRKLMDKLANEVVISGSFWDYMQLKIDAFAFLGTEQREKIAKDLMHQFPTNKTAQEIARLFATTKTDTIELGLASFSHDLEEELEEFKGKKRKFDLLSIMAGKKQQQENQE